MHLLPKYENYTNLPQNYIMIGRQKNFTFGA